MTAGGSAVPSCWRRSGPGRKISRDTVLAMPPSTNVRLEIFGSGPLPPKTRLLRTPWGEFRKFLWRAWRKRTIWHPVLDRKIPRVARGILGGTEMDHQYQRGVL